MKASRDENKEQANRAYELMFEAARTWLIKKDAADIAADCGAEYDPDNQLIKLSSMGDMIRIQIPQYTSDPILENWHQLILMHYLKNADGTPLTGELITIRDIKDGLIRGTKFERKANEVFQRILKGYTEEDILIACQRLGARQTRGRGDISVCIPFFPNCPMYINFWLADEEFDANGKMFFDASVNHYLSIEDAVTVGEIVLNRLEMALKEGM